MSGELATAIFGVRNVDKTLNGDLGRGLVVLGQGTKTLENVANADFSIFGTWGEKVVSEAKRLDGMVEAAAGENGLLGKTAKGAKIASKYVNPLLCFASGLRVLKSDNWRKSSVEEIGAMSAMFFAESRMKNVRKSIYENYISKIRDKKYKIGAMILTEIAFVVGSITAFGIGKFLAKKITKRD